LSGIVGILNKDGAPVSRALLQALTRFLDYRGPDARDAWTLGAVGFGHTMLRTTRESLNERQPFGLDGRFWITSDARLDSRAALIAKLENAQQSFTHTASDSELILHAYAAWNEECVHHLRGDFSFAIWDIAEKKLFCARDHFGIKPFYYADVGDTFVFSNTLNCVRLHPLVKDELNDLAILDFLLVGENSDNGATTFQDIRRLAPGHALTVSSAGARQFRYWGMPIDGRVRYDDERDYVDHFRSLFQNAVSDRIRTDSVGIFLSGGLDSSSIAATARKSVAIRVHPLQMHAYTSVSESLIRDSEGIFARRVAEHLEIPIQFHHHDDSKPLEGWDDPANTWPEPVDDPFFADVFTSFQTIARNCRAVFNGEGNDALMSFEMMPYGLDLWRRREIAELAKSMLRFLRVRRFPVRGIMARAKNLFGFSSDERFFPSWISTSLANRARARERWCEINGAVTRKHPVVPLAFASLSLPSWTPFFESNDPGVTRSPVEVRYPFLDLRVVEFLLAIPPFPWFYEKALLRRAMKGELPPQILNRPKTPLAEDPLIAHLQLAHAAAIDQLTWNEEIRRFVDPAAVPKLMGEDSPEKARAAIRSHSLNFWLRYSRPLRYNLVAEAVNG
jgi:asparagine synthase (glutamine-hydrolysing)